MESNIRYAVITTKEHKELIEDNINKEKCIKELEKYKKAYNRFRKDYSVEELEEKFKSNVS